MSRVLQIFLSIWLFGSAACMIWSISMYVGGGEGRFRLLLEKLQAALVWPVALLIAGPANFVRFFTKK